MVIKGLSDAQITKRIMELLADGNSEKRIAETLRDEDLVDVSSVGIHYHIRKIVSDPSLSMLLDVERKVVSLRKTAWLTEIAETQLRDLLDIADSLKAQIHDVEKAGNPQTLKSFNEFLKSLSVWWKNVSDLHNAIKREEGDLNLTQINIGQMTTVNGQLLSIIQDAMRWLPLDKRNVLTDRLRDIETEKV